MSVWSGGNDLTNSFGSLQFVQRTGDWAGLPVLWNENKDNKDGKTIEVINHIYQFNINLKTGNLFLDCTKSKWATKCFVYAIVQPTVLAIKTLSHLTGISLAVKIYQKVKEMNNVEGNPQGKISLKDKSIQILKVLGQEVTDIVRTPLYASALTILGVAGAIIGPFAPRNFVFKVVEIAGKVELSLHRGEESRWIVFECFQPIANITTIKDEWVRRRSDQKTTEQGLINCASSQICFQRTHRAIFNNCGFLLSEDFRYVSPYVEECRASPAEESMSS